MKQDFSHLTIAINGGVKSLEEAKVHLQHLDGVMIGREAYQSPYLLASVDQELFGSNAPVKKRSEIVEEMYPYIESAACERCVSWSYHASYVGFVPKYAGCSPMASSHQ
ncbi:tRNA-dihydrouridine synthase A [Vibrio parahaemolyticus]|nr:tRNA-dihydrouridine synthase A [Vibrio parahaemolyticus]